MWIGIDIGTSGIRAGVLRDGYLQCICDPFDQGATIPSAVFAQPCGDWLIGRSAENARPQHPERYQHEFKRDLGTSEPYLLGDRTATAESVYSLVLAWVRAEAGRTLAMSGPVSGAVIAVPPVFEEFRRASVRRAALTAGFTDVELLDEPVAAATGEPVAVGRQVFVWDFGGAGFMATALEPTATGFQMLARPVGLTEGGGSTYERAIFHDLRQSIPAVAAVLDAPNNPTAARVRDEVWNLCHRVKHQLTVASDAEVWVTQVAPPQPYRLNRAEFDRLIGPHVSRALTVSQPIWREIVRQGEPEPLVLVVGGSSRVPVVARMIRDELGVSPVVAADPELAVIRGAAKRASERNRLIPSPATPPPVLSRKTIREAPPRGKNPFDNF